MQCPWRLDSPKGTVTGPDDLWEYAGPGERPPNWSYDDGLSLQDKKFAELFVRDESTQSWVNDSDGFGVATVHQTKRGDVTLSLINGYEILIFPAGSGSEAWRLFAPGSGRHMVFPSPERDYAISRRKNVDNSEWEAWLKVVEAPKAGEAMRAPPTVIVTADGTRYRCGRCGRVLVIAEFGALKDFVIHCTSCKSYNVVSI